VEAAAIATVARVKAMGIMHKAHARRTVKLPWLPSSSGRTPGLIGTA